MGRVDLDAASEPIARDLDTFRTDPSDVHDEGGALARIVRQDEDVAALHVLAAANGGDLTTCSITGRLGAFGRVRSMHLDPSRPRVPASTP